LSNIELGLKNPGIKTLTKLSRYYRTPLDRLLHAAGREDEIPEPAQQESIIDIQRAYDFVMGDPTISRFERLTETPSPEIQRFVIGMYEHYTGKKLI
jgi:transcriptional regulator with XRE-family HTH domain